MCLIIASALIGFAWGFLEGYIRATQRAEDAQMQLEAEKELPEQKP